MLCEPRVGLTFRSSLDKVSQKQVNMGWILGSKMEIVRVVGVQVVGDIEKMHGIWSLQQREGVLGEAIVSIENNGLFN